MRTFNEEKKKTQTPKSLLSSLSLSLALSKKRIKKIVLFVCLGFVFFSRGKKMERRWWRRGWDPILAGEIRRLAV